MQRWSINVEVLWLARLESKQLALEPDIFPSLKIARVWIERDRQLFMQVFTVSKPYSLFLLPTWRSHYLKPPTSIDRA